jgi:hypothetical protein
MNLARPIVIVDRRTYRRGRQKIAILMDQGEYTRAKSGLTAAML